MGQALVSNTTDNAKKFIILILLRKENLLNDCKYMKIICELQLQKLIWK